MASVLVPYGTAAERTPAAVDRLCQTLAARGHEPTDVEAAVFPANVSIEGFDAVVVAATGGPEDAAEDDATNPRPLPTPEDAVAAFADSYLREMTYTPTALVQCWPPTPVVDPADRARAAAELEGLIADTAWYPDRVAALGGPLAYERHGFLRLLDLERLAGDAEADDGEDGEGDDGDGWSHAFETSLAAADGESADGGAVAALADDLAAFVEGRLGTAPGGRARASDDSPAPGRDDGED